MFYEKLRKSWVGANSLLCVGLDPDLTKMPSAVKDKKFPIFEFNRAIIDATAEYACAFKPQIAFYAAAGAENQLKMTMEYLREKYPHKVTILDAKRGDIGSTAEMYAKEAFDVYDADAVTLNPYLGTDSLLPFFNRRDRGSIILCRTSNPGAATLQNLKTDQGATIYELVATLAKNEWNTNQNIALVVGATYPKELKQIRGICSNIPFLVPGFGAQGGGAKEIIENGIDSDGFGLIVNSSRAILYASSGSDFAKAAAGEAQRSQRELNSFRS